MELAFALFGYFPYGGLERDMLAMARACRQRGHAVTIYTASWQGERPADIPVVILSAGAFTNHGRGRAFAHALQRTLADKPQTVVVGFNKMPGLHVYYAADVCFAAKAFEERGPLYRLTPRCRGYLALERAVFEPASKTEVLMISRAQIGVYQRYYRTPDARLHMLPPGIRRERVMPADYAEQRARLRQSYGLDSGDHLMLMVGSDFKRKGLDRSIQALAALPPALRARTRLWVAGQDKAAPFEQLAQTLGIADRVRILGGRDDVSQLLWSADLLLHPAYSENTGTALLEGMVAGLPVIASSVCGYAHYIEEQQMGAVLAEPVDIADFAAAIAAILAQDGSVWRERALRFSAEADVFSMTERAAELIERLWSGNERGADR